MSHAILATMVDLVRFYREDTASGLINRDHRLVALTYDPDNRALVATYDERVDA